MKANEAPENIYAYIPDDDIVGTASIKKGIPHQFVTTEYTRTDAFIEKACEFIRKGGNRGNAYIVTEFGEEVFDFVQLAEDFKKYMKGE